MYMLYTYTGLLNKQKENEMKTKKKKSIVLRILVLCVSLYLFYSLTDLCTELISKQKELENYREQIKVTDRRIAEYKELLAEGNEAKIIEKAARERLGYVYADEQVFIDISGS